MSKWNELPEEILNNVLMQFSDEPWRKKGFLGYIGWNSAIWDTVIYGMKLTCRHWNQSIGYEVFLTKFPKKPHWTFNSLTDKTALLDGTIMIKRIGNVNNKI